MLLAVCPMRPLAACYFLFLTLCCPVSPTFIHARIEGTVVERDIEDVIKCKLSTHPDLRQTYCTTKGGCYKQQLLDKEDGSILVSYGCLAASAWQPRNMPLTCLPSKLSRNRIGMACCNDVDFCNANLTADILLDAAEPPRATLTSRLSANAVWIAVTVTGALFILLMALAVTCLIRHGSRRASRRAKLVLMGGGSAVCGKELTSGDSKPLVNNEQLQSVKDYLDSMNENSFSGSGRGLPLLVQRRIARQIQVTHKIGAGRFGQVYRGIWRGEDVAVKIFHSREEKSWFREVEIYLTTMLRHENLLGFIAADNKDTSVTTQLWLITEFHQNGSLYDYLYNCVVSQSEMVRMARSIVNGLSHLHTEITGAPYSKPAIAHQDLKSKNILVKNDLTCCIGDMGLAVRYDSAKATIDIPKYCIGGTKRYMAPEMLMLEGGAQLSSFDAYKRADIYSLGLVLWEICRRTVVNGKFDTFELPYFEDVSGDPEKEEMRQCIVVRGVRPRPSETWLSDEGMTRMISIMEECWTGNPGARLTALRARKSIESIPLPNVIDI